MARAFNMLDCFRDAISRKRPTFSITLEGRMMCKANKKLFEKMPLVSNLPVNIIEFNNFSREMSRQL